MPVRLRLTAAAPQLANRGYDSDAIVQHASQQGMQGVIPPRKNRKVPQAYDAALYRHRHLVENEFLQLSVNRKTQS